MEELTSNEWVWRGKPKRRVFAVVRVDLDRLPPGAPGQNASEDLHGLVITQILPTAEEARSQAKRLNALNVGTGWGYYVMATRYFPEGRSTPPTVETGSTPATAASPRHARSPDPPAQDRRDPDGVRSVDENPNCARTYATFCLAGDALKPDEVSAALGLTPTWALAKHDEIPVGRKGKTTRRQPTGVWLLRTDDTVDSTDLERHLIYLLDAVEPASHSLAALRRHDDLKTDFFCFWLSATGHGGPVISPATLARIAALDTPLGIDFYGP